MRNKLTAIGMAAMIALSGSAGAALEQWTFDTEADGVSITNLVNTGTEGTAHFGADHVGAFVTNGALRFTPDATEACYRLAELTTADINSGIYELNCSYTYENLTENNAAFGVFLRSKETYLSATKSSTDLFQLRIHVVSGVPNIQTRVLQPDDNSGIVNHMALPTSATNVDVRLTLDVVNNTLNGEVVYEGVTNAFSRQVLDLPVDYLRMHATPDKFVSNEYFEMDNIEWKFIEEGELQDVIFIDYSMNDTNGAPIGALEQTGLDSESFGSGATAPGIAADGMGNLVFTNLTENEFSGHNLGTVITEGIVEVEYKLSEWNLAAISETGNNFGFEIRDNAASGDPGVKITIDQKAAGTRINWVASGGDAPRQTLSVSNGVDLIVKMQLDLDNGTFAAFFNEGNGWVKKAENQAFTATQFDQFRLVADGTPTWGAGAYAKVDYVRVTLPKPKSLVDFQFDEVANTDLKDLWNNGSISSNWNFNSQGDIFADGNGNLQLLDVTNTYTRSVILGESALTNDIVTMDWRVDEWDLAGLAGSDGFTFDLKDTVDNELVKAKFFLTSDSSDVRMTMTDAASEGKQQNGFGISNTVGVTFRMVADLEDELFNGYYKIDGGSWTEITTSNNVGLARIDEIRLSVNPEWSGDETGFANIDYLTLTSEVKMPTGPENPQEWYDDWAAGFEGFTDTALDSNPDNDLVNNLYEYGLGGDPEDGNSVGYESILDASGADYIEYVHPQRNDSEARGLTYYIELTESLTTPDWTNANYTVTGTNLNVEVGFDAVTNRVPTSGKNVQFIRLIIEADGVTP